MAKKIMKYNPAFLTDEELIQSFVVRHADLDLVINTISENSTESNQHVLIIGPRGSGKTTLARRIALEVRRSRELQSLWHPLIFAEESYEVISAGEFWLEALFHISEQTGDVQWARTYEELKNESDEKILRERALSQLMDFADSQGKRLLLIVENLNMLLKQISPEDAWALRHTLLNEPRLMLLATATPGFEEIENVGHAMFELFKIQELKALDEGECSDMWKMVTGLEAPDNRIRPLQILTGGNPRLLAIISKFGAKLSLKELMDDLIHLVDDHTDYFKSQLDNLATIERKAYLALAEIWDPATAREIGKAARLDVNKTSSLLSRLVKRGYVTVIETKGKTKWYQVKERLYNIYYLMRRRGAPENRVKAVVKFMIDFYGHDDLVKAVKSIAEEACRLSLDESRDHYFAYEEILKNTPAQEIRDKIIESTPSDFFESSMAPPPIKAFTEVDSVVKEVKGAITKGLKLSMDKNCEEAINILDSLISKYKARPEPQIVEQVIKAMFIRGLSFGASGRSEEATQVFDEFIEMYKERTELKIVALVATAMMGKGVHLSMLGKSEEAIQVYDNLIEIYKKRPEPEVVEQVAEAMLYKGHSLGVLGKSEEAIRVYNVLIETLKERSEPKIVEHTLGAMHAKGVGLGKLGRQEEEIQVYNELIEIYKGWSEPKIAEQVAMAMLKQALISVDLGKLEEAIQSYDELIETYKDQSESQIVETVADAMLFKGVNLGEAGHHEEEEGMYRMTIEYKEDFFLGWGRLIGLVLKRLDGQKEALLLAETCINKNPENPGIMNSMACLFYKHGDRAFFEHAEIWAKKALELAPDKAAFHHTLACILAVSNKGDEALLHAKEYLKDTALIEKGVDDAIELFVELAVAGFAKEALELLVKSTCATLLEPLTAGLKLFIGQEVKAAAEIMEVAGDIVKKIKEGEEKRGKLEIS